MKKFIGTMLLCFVVFINYAQEKQFYFSGKIVDKESKEAIVFATIIYSKQSVISNELGEFKFLNPIAQVNNILKVKMVGYIDYEENISLKNNNNNVLIQLIKTASKLKDLEITSIRATDNAPFTKTNLNKSEINKLNIGQDLPFLLNQTPSVVVNSDAGNGVGYTGISIRGTDASRINVTLNGIPFNDAESQGVFFVDLPDFSSSLNSIQIQRGVGTSSNGTGAFGATINLSTNELNEKPSTEINNSFGSFNTIKNTVKVSTGLINNCFTIDARLSKIKSNGYIDRAKSNLQSFALSGAYLNKNSSLKFNIFSGVEKTYQAWNGVDATNLINNPTFNISGTEKIGEPYNNETDNYNQTHYQLFFNKTITKNWSYSIAAYFTKGMGYYENYKAAQKYTKYGLTNPTFTNTDLIRQQWLDNDFYGQIFSVQHKKNKSVLTIGGNWSDYKGKHFGEIIWAANGGIPLGYKYYNLNAIKIERSFYIKLQQNIAKNIELFLDGQYRFVNHTMNGFKENPNLIVDRKFNFINPKFGLTYSKNNCQTYFSYALANKEPNRNDFQSSLITQPKAETLHDFELGFETKKSNFTFGATAYYMLYKNQLVLTGKINDVGAYTRSNVDKSYRLGLELQGSYTITKWLNLNANATFSKNKIKEFSEFVDNYDAGGQLEIKHSNSTITLSPSVISNLQFNFILSKKINFSLISKYVSKQYLDNTKNEQRILNSFYTQDARAIINISNKFFKETVLMISANNIFNKMYQPNGYTFSYIYNGDLTTENFYFPMSGTNFMLSLNIKL